MRRAVQRSTGRIVLLFGVAACLETICAGCSSLLGFDRAEVVDCLHNSDCSPGLFCIDHICTVECNTVADCQGPGFGDGLVCSVDHVCVPEAMVTTDASYAVPDALEATPDVRIDSAPSAAADAMDGCGGSCQLGLCVGTQCIPGFAALPTSADGMYTVQSGFLQGVQVQVPGCYEVVGIGFALPTPRATQAHIRLAVYDDDNGPTTRLAETALGTTGGARTELPIEGSPARIGCDGHATKWIFFASDAQVLDELTLQASTTVTTPWLFSVAATGMISSYLDGGLPATTPWAGNPELPQNGVQNFAQPVIYPLVVSAGDD